MRAKTNEDKVNERSVCLNFERIVEMGVRFDGQQQYHLVHALRTHTRTLTITLTLYIIHSKSLFIR